MSHPFVTHHVGEQTEQESPKRREIGDMRWLAAFLYGHMRQAEVLGTLGVMLTVHLIARV